MSNIDTMDLVELEDRNVDVMVLLNEWETLVDELSEKEIALYQWKECYQIKADEIIGNTDFKALTPEDYPTFSDVYKTIRGRILSYGEATHENLLLLSHCYYFT